MDRKGIQEMEVKKKGLVRVKYYPKTKGISNTCYLWVKTREIQTLVIEGHLFVKKEIIHKLVTSIHW